MTPLLPATVTRATTPIAHAPIALLPLRTSFDKREWHVRPVSLPLAQRMVEQYHYAKHGSTWRVYTFGLFLRRDPNCWGVTWWIPAPKLSVDKYNPGGYKTTLILSRMVIHPLVPTNGASFLLSASVKRIASIGRYDTLMTYADTWRGHSGAVYRASNWHYEGMSEPTAIWLDNRGVLGSTYCSGRIQTRTEMERKGYTLHGRYPKHIFTMRIPVKKQAAQLPMFAGMTI
jgi:hypothetical protein